MNDHRHDHPHAARHGHSHGHGHTHGIVKPVMLVAGNDADRMPEVIELVGKAGFEPVDAGPLKNARLPEPCAIVWINQAMMRHRRHAFLKFNCIRRNDQLIKVVVLRPADDRLSHERSRSTDEMGHVVLYGSLGSNPKAPAARASAV